MKIYWGSSHLLVSLLVTTLHLSHHHFANCMISWPPSHSGFPKQQARVILSSLLCNGDPSPSVKAKVPRITHKELHYRPSCLSTPHFTTAAVTSLPHLLWHSTPVHFAVACGSWHTGTCPASWLWHLLFPLPSGYSLVPSPLSGQVHFLSEEVSYLKLQPLPLLWIPFLPSTYHHLTSACCICLLLLSPHPRAVSSTAAAISRLFCS